MRCRRHWADLTFHACARLRLPASISKTCYQSSKQINPTALWRWGNKRGFRYGGIAYRIINMAIVIDFFPLSLFQNALTQNFGDLNGVQSGTFAQVIRYAPQIDSIF